MKKTLLSVLTIIILSLTVKAQEDFKFGTFLNEDMAMKSYSKDTSAHAVVLMEHGRCEIARTGDDDINLVYEYHVKIKIFDKSALDLGNIEIPYYIQDDRLSENVEDIEAKTTYINDNGMVTSETLNSKNVFDVVKDKHWGSKKFAMPGMHNNCIIEYRYKIISPYIQSLHSWQFQSSIPKIHSEYDVHIPGFWDFNAALVGPLSVTTKITEVEKECFSYRGAKCDCSHFLYEMNDIPAFIVEADMTAPKNFMSAINFELKQYTSFETGSAVKVAKEWKDVDYDLKHDDYFGSQLKKVSLFKDRITPVVAGKTDELDKAKAIYVYIKKAIKWNNVYARGSSDGIRKALDDKSGNVAEVNMALVDALNAAGLNTEAVLLSTRDNGRINKLYPVVTEFNYLVAKLNIGDKSYLLDATDPLLPFGIIPMRCLNDQGRVMSLDKPSYWIDMNTPQKESDTYSLDFTLHADGKMTGTITHFSMGYAAYEKRKEIKEFNSVDEYIENLNSKSEKTRILKADITNLDSLDLPLSEVFNVEVNEYKNTDHENFTFNPYKGPRVTINPFKLAVRNYPVDWGMPSSTRYIMTLHLPDNFVVETPAQKVGLKLPDNGGSFLTDYSSNGTNLTFSYIFQFNKSIYSADEYPYLKEFYNKVILTEKDYMTFSKSK